MRSPTRSQADFTPEYCLTNSLENSAPLAPKDEPKLVRQEFGAEADINTLVNRFGPLTRLPGADDHGEFDLTMDLTDHFDNAQRVARGYDKLPQHVKDRYSLTEFMSRLSQGEEIDLSEPEETPTPPVAPTPQE